MLWVLRAKGDYMKMLTEGVAPAIVEVVVRAGDEIAARNLAFVQCGLETVSRMSAWLNHDLTSCEELSIAGAEEVVVYREFVPGVCTY